VWGGGGGEKENEEKLSYAKIAPFVVGDSITSPDGNRILCVKGCVFRTVKKGGGGVGGGWWGWGGVWPFMPPRKWIC